MPQGIQDAYLETRITTADPIELIRLLYQGGMDAVRDARRRLADGDIAGRSRAISKAYAITAELMASLDRDRGGEVAERLVRLYDYVQRRLLEANFAQADGPLAEVLSLLNTLAEGWEGVAAQMNGSEPVSAAPLDPWEPPAEPAPAASPMPWGLPAEADYSGYSSHAWSF